MGIKHSGERLMDRIYQTSMYQAQSRITGATITVCFLSIRAWELMEIKNSNDEWIYRIHQIIPVIYISPDYVIRSFQPSTGMFFATRLI